jgi:phosphomannomutase
MRAADDSRIAESMARLRALRPRELAGRRVTRIRDLLIEPGELPPADVVVLELDGGRVVVRPSGTEPLLKAYFETVEAAGSDLTRARERAASRSTALRNALTSMLTG